MSRTIGSVDQRLSLANGYASRLLEFLTTWTVCRIGIRFCFNGVANLTGTPQLAFGLCAGTDNTYADPTTDNFLGIIIGATATWTYAGSPAYYGAVSGKIRKRVGVTNTDGGSFASSNVHFPAAAATNRSALIVEITKGTPNFTVNAVHPSSTAGAQIDISDADMVAMMEASTMAGAAAMVSGYTHQTAGALTLAIDEAVNGYLNAINIYWDRSGTALEISDTKHRRVA